MVDLCPSQMVWYSNYIWIPDKLVRFSNSQLALRMHFGLKNGPVFKWLKRRWPILLFEIRHKLCPENDHLNTGHSFQMVMVFLTLKNY
jgi:hypothetical protein